MTGPHLIDDASPGGAGPCASLRSWEAASGAREPSGPAWVARFPDDRELSSLELPFAIACQAFLEALAAAGAEVRILATRRPRERDYLMHFAYCIATALIDPALVPPMPGVAIDWVHATPVASRDAAQAMIDGYGLRDLPLLDASHCAGRGIDLEIAWSGTLRIACADGTSVDIAAPRDGSNLWLHVVGASYGVHKPSGAPPHWSDDGR